MKKIKAIQYGCGNLGRHTLRYMMEKGIEVVGVVDVNPTIVGKDISEILGLEKKTGIVVKNNVEDVLKETNADIAMLTLAPTMEDIYPHVIKCIEKGVNVITSAEGLIFPWQLEKEYVTKMNAIAKENDATVVGSGTQAQYVDFVKAVSTTCHKMNKISVTIFDNSEYSSEEAVKPFGVGLTQDEFKKVFTNDPETMIPSFYWPQAYLVGSALGWNIDKVEQKDIPVIAKKDFKSESLQRIIPEGDCLGVQTIVSASTMDGKIVEFNSIIAAFDPEDPNKDTQLWEFEGEPNVKLTLSAIDMFPTTAAGLVNRIPEVLASPAGVINLTDLPMPKYKEEF